MKYSSVVFFGDSITRGGWAEIVAKKLVIPKNKVTCYDLGINGDTTRLGLERMSEIYRLKPDIVTVQFGANDCNIWDSDCGVERVNERAYYYNLIEMVRKIRAHGAHDIILLTTHLKPRDTVMGVDKLESYNHRLAMYNELVREAAGVWGCELCDMEAVIKKSDVLPENCKYIHLNASGNLKYAQAIMPMIKELLKELVSRSY